MIMASNTLAGAVLGASISMEESVEVIIKSIEGIKGFSAEARQRTAEWLRSGLSRSKEPVRIIIMGETGVGKSTLLNGLVGAKVFQVGKELTPGTLTVQEHKVTIHGIEFLVYDCPGLQDGTGNEQAYLDDLRSKLGDCKSDVMLYCMRMNARRLAGHTKAITMVTESFLGKDIWKNVVVILTFANVFEQTLRNTQRGHGEEDIRAIFEAKVHEYRAEIQEVLLKNGVKKDVVQDLSVQPAGHYRKRSLPGHHYWLSDLWGNMLIAAETSTQQLLVAASGLDDRFREEQDVCESDFEKSAEQQPIVATETVRAGLNSVVGEEITTFLKKIGRFRCTLL